MSTLTTFQKSRKAPVRSRVRKPRTMEAFLQWDQPEGNYKYEWVDGTLEKTEYMMKNTERLIVYKINRAFQTSLRDVQVGLKKDVCSATPAIPDLQLTVEELFGEEAASA